jgi:hypothetical protein
MPHKTACQIHTNGITFIPSTSIVTIGQSDEQYQRVDTQRFFDNHKLSRLSGRKTDQQLQNCPNLAIYRNKLAGDFGLNASNQLVLTKMQRTHASSVYIKHVDVSVSLQYLGMLSTASCRVDLSHGVTCREYGDVRW